MGKNVRGFRGYAVFVVVYTIATILWGAWVRITGSGAGCGSHWPSCNGEIIPRSPTVETMIEYSHRLTSGLTLVFTVILFFWAKKRFGLKSLVGMGAAGTLFFVLAEAALGAGLVLFELVGNNDSVERAIVIAFHLINTFGLIAFGVITIWGTGTRRLVTPTGEWKRAFIPLTVLLLLVGMSGAITALGDTLFPVDTSIGLIERLEKDLSPAEHFLVRLRYIHPIISIATAIGLVWLCLFAKPRTSTSTLSSNGLLWAVIAQTGLGWLNVELGAPGYMQIIHLLMADVLWVLFVWFALDVRSVEAADEQTAAVAPAAVPSS